tara:strand:- start:5185 stop:5868 length:684 start_codon:yes stop_codon:yes gene_type:complete
MKKTITALSVLILSACNADPNYLPVQDMRQVPTPDWPTSDWYQHSDIVKQPDKSIDTSCCFPLKSVDTTSNEKTLLKRVCKVGDKHYFQDPLTKKYHQVHLAEPKTKHEFPIKPKDYFVVKGERVLTTDAIVMNDVIRYVKAHKDKVEFALVKDGKDHTGFSSAIIWNTKTDLFGTPGKGGLYRGGMKEAHVEGYIKDKKPNSPINANLNIDGFVNGGLVKVIGGCK